MPAKVHKQPGKISRRKRHKIRGLFTVRSSRCPYMQLFGPFRPSSLGIGPSSSLLRTQERGHVLDFIFQQLHPATMKWRVQIAEEFEIELSVLPLEVRRAILAHSRLLQEFGPQLGRPRVDTLNGSRYANMKEMRFGAADREWRVAFAFDPAREAVLLVAGDKSGGSERRFYRELIRKADERFDRHIVWLAKK